MQRSHSTIPFLTRLVGIVALLCLSVIILALFVGDTFPSPFISFTLSEFENHYDRYDKLHVIDLRTGLSTKISDQLVSCCAVWSPDGTRIAFTSWQGQPFVWDTRDGITRTLASPDVNAVVADWSPDSESIILSVFKENQGYRLYRVNSDGSQIKDLSVWGDDTYKIIYDADWSPDGRFIVFAANINTVWEIYRIDADGRNLRQLTPFGDSNIIPQVSPDSQRIAFVSEYNQNMELFVMNADGSDLHQLTWTDGNEGLALWSPDGTRLLFQTYVNDNFPRVLDVMNADGSDRRRLADYTTFNNPPSWSPDGKQILYEVQTGKGNGSDLYLMDIDGGQRRLLAHDDFATSLKSAWQP